MYKTYIFAMSAFAAATVYAQSSEITKPEFAGHCAMSLALGKVVDTDCSINWVEQDSKKKYCFSSSRMKTVWISTTADKIKLASESSIGADIKEDNVYRGDSDHDH